MATGNFEFTGSIGNFSYYKRHDMDKVIVRTKGGPSREKVRHSPDFENTRRNNKEFAGRSRATMYIKRGLDTLVSLADYNIAGYLNARLKPVQDLDATNEWGKRSVLLSKNPGIL